MLVKIDLITGFLGSGKTTFIKKFARYLMELGENIGILENDFGAVNVDMMLLQIGRANSVNWRWSQADVTMIVIKEDLRLNLFLWECADMIECW